jgi:osmotically-inducible protein OsmY
MKHAQGKNNTSDARMPRGRGATKATDVMGRGGVAAGSDVDVASGIDALLADPMRAPEDLDVEVSVSDGVVVMTGTTRWPSDIEVLRSMLRRMPGVVVAELRLTAREPDPDPTTALPGDPWIESARPGGAVGGMAWGSSE